ncbi:hypothetical protein GCM10009599_09620 [Luteococcus peritonei]
MRRREHPLLVGALEWLQRQGEAVAVLPGVLVASGAAGELAARVAAVRAWDPDAVVTGLAAARLGYWPEASVGEVVVLTRRRPRPRPGFRFVRATVDPEHVTEVEGVRITSPTWTALWLAAQDEGRATDEALRALRTSPARLAEVLEDLRGRRGTRMRRFVVANSRERPWSPAERTMHQLLHRAGIGGWHGNWRIAVGGRAFYADIAFPEINLVLEFDGFESHSRREVFHADREKALLLMQEGWLVVRFSHTQLADPELFLGFVRQAIAMARRLCAS